MCSSDPIIVVLVAVPPVLQEEEGEVTLRRHQQRFRNELGGSPVQGAERGEAGDARRRGDEEGDLQHLAVPGEGAGGGAVLLVDDVGGFIDQSFLHGANIAAEFESRSRQPQGGFQIRILAIHGSSSGRSSLLCNVYKTIWILVELDSENNREGGVMELYRLSPSLAPSSAAGHHRHPRCSL